MARTFKKEDYSFILGGKILKYNNTIYFNPSESTLLKLGFTEVEVPEVFDTATIINKGVYPDAKYEILVNRKIRKQYTASESEGILRKAIAKLVEFTGLGLDEFPEFTEFCEAMKIEAKEELGLIETEEITETTETEEETV